jgi:hypothetical protein
MTGPTTAPGSGPDPQSPTVVTNPPGLASIADRVDDFTGFRRAMLRPLPGEQAIGAWRPGPGDLGLQILEWWAYLADVLTFYNERIANESYLRTATQPASLANLVAQLGYAPAPGIAATGTVAAVRKAGHPTEPLVIPEGMRLSSVATPGVASQTFEVDAGASFTGPSSVPVTLPADPTFQHNGDGTQSVLLAGRVSGVKAGDQLLLVGQSFAGADDHWSLVTVSALTPAVDPGTAAVNTLVTFSAPTAGSGLSSTATDYRLMRPTAAASLWTQGGSNGAVIDRLTTPIIEPIDRPVGPIFERAGASTFERQAILEQRVSPFADRPVGPMIDRPIGAIAGRRIDLEIDEFPRFRFSASGLVAHLSAVVPAITPGEMVLFDGSAAALSPALGVVTANSEIQVWMVPYTVPDGSTTPPQPFIVIPHTQLTLALGPADLSALLGMQNTVESVLVRYGFKDVGTIIGIPQATLPSLPATVGVSTADAAFLGPTALLQDANGAGLPVTLGTVTSGAAVSDQVTLTGAGIPPAAIATPLAVPLQLLLDVVPVSRGTTVSDEVLGSGNAALVNQSFTLSKSPLTYLEGDNGPQSALTVYVDGVAWQEAPSFYGQTANAAVFVVSRSADQTVTAITFGDGVNGARLTSGRGNVLATYRYGSGLASPPARRLTTISQPQANLASLQNPVAVSGGGDPQAPEEVRADAPASVTTFQRAISASDYELIAAQAPGVARAAAAWSFDGGEQRTLVNVYVDDDPGAVASASAALTGAADPNRLVSVFAATPVEVRLSCELLVAADRQVTDVVSAAAAAIGDPAAGLFSPARMGIGQTLYRSAVVAALIVPGVVAVHTLRVHVRGMNSAGGVFDPGPGSFFVLTADEVAITGVSASD